MSKVPVGTLGATRPPGGLDKCFNLWYNMRNLNTELGSPDERNREE